ncbi:DJ-1/PfpI family protein [Nocardia sp. BMG111209]|uniref:DJ-1/PfpI family protein n=1 Tax=Nocardia sp. BMG111209 TaxID=1160137 RepID=UPI0003678B89|nr:DJ-1/PfpI family protein [Nocardia sp. BMG111209]
MRTVLRRLAWISLSAVLAVATSAAVLGAGVATSMARDFAVLPVAGPLPPVRPRDPSGRIPVAVLLGAGGSVATDALGPFDVFASSPEFDVYTVSVHRRPLALSGGLTVVPDYSLDDLAAGRAPAPAVVVVPALTDPTGRDEAPLREYLREAHGAGRIVMSVCAGARVLAAAGVLDGRSATSFWSDIPGLSSSYPRTRWQSGVRWVQDGDILTTAGVSSGIAGALRLVAQLTGPARAAEVASSIGYPGGRPDVAETIPAHRISVADYPYALAAALPWFQPRRGLGLTPGVDEIAVAAAAEMYSGASFLDHLIPVAAEPVVRTRHGLTLLATPVDAAGRLDRLIVPGVATTDLGRPGTPMYLPHADRRPGESAFEPIFADIARDDGRHTAATIAKYIEYPLTAALPGGTFPPRILGLLAAVLGLAIAVALLPYQALRLSRRRLAHRRT